MQPIIVDRLGTARFKANELIVWATNDNPLSFIIKHGQNYCEQADLDQALQLLGVTINHKDLSQACRDEAFKVLKTQKEPGENLFFSYDDGYSRGFSAGYEQAKHDILSALNVWKQEQLERAGQ